jgi:fructose-1,6-bisphosphatase/sedoheptulose 1,7-bisphosphatase-like protein
MLFHVCMQRCILISMQSTSVRIDQTTHQELKRLAEQLGTTVGETVALAVRRLRQDRIGEELTATLSPDEVDWLDADLG